MTKEALNKHWEALAWWKDKPEGAEIWCKGSLNKWNLSAQPTWNIECEYVINDKYAEYKKAEIEGKQIQYRTYNHFGDTVEECNHKTEWIDTTIKEFRSSLQYSDIEFRIKPDEPQYQVGDWVTPLVDKMTEFSDVDRNKLVRYSQSKHPYRILIVNEKSQTWDESYVIREKGFANEVFHADELKPWEPSKGEWCWFYDCKKRKEPDLRQFSHTEYDCYYTDENTRYIYCEPFVGEHPSIIKG